MRLPCPLRTLPAIWALLAAPGAISAQATSGPGLVVWQPLGVDSLEDVERAALRLTPDLHPAQWSIERAHLTLGGRVLLLLNGKIGSGSGFGYYAAYAFTLDPVRLVWSTATRVYLAPGEFLSQGQAPFELRGCLFAHPDSLAYAVAVISPGPTAMAAATTDTLVRPSAWYRWAADGSALTPSAPVPQSLLEVCRSHDPTN